MGFAMAGLETNVEGRRAGWRRTDEGLVGDVLPRLLVLGRLPSSLSLLLSLSLLPSLEAATSVVSLRPEAGTRGVSFFFSKDVAEAVLTGLLRASDSLRGCRSERVCQGTVIQC